MLYVKFSLLNVSHTMIMFTEETLMIVYQVKYLNITYIEHYNIGHKFSPPKYLVYIYLLLYPVAKCPVWLLPY